MDKTDITEMLNTTNSIIFTTTDDIDECVEACRKAGETEKVTQALVDMLENVDLSDIGADDDEIGAMLVDGAFFQFDSVLEMLAKAEELADVVEHAVNLASDFVSAVEEALNDGAGWRDSEDREDKRSYRESFVTACERVASTYDEMEWTKETPDADA